LNALRKEHIPVSIYLVNGIKLQGQIDSFDQYVVLLKNTVHADGLQARDFDRGSRPCRQFDARPSTDSLMSCCFPTDVDRPVSNTKAVLVSLDFGEPDYAENLEEVRLLTASAGVTAAGVVKGAAAS